MPARFDPATGDITPMTPENKCGGFQATPPNASIEDDLPLSRACLAKRFVLGGVRQTSFEHR
jgi:hypothetical protein